MVVIAVIIAAVVAVYVWRRRMDTVKVTDVDGDGVTLRDDQQLQEVENQMIELEESVERVDGDVATNQITA